VKHIALQWKAGMKANKIG